MTVALVRHGRTAWNLARRMQGRADIPLDAHGRAQAESAAELLSRASWDRIVTSPLRRASETASLIRMKLAHAEVTTDAHLIERDYGVAEGMAVSEARERWPESDYPDAEPLNETTQRARRVLTRIERLEGNSIVVAHGTLLRVGVEALTAGKCPRILNGQVVLLERDGAERLVARFLS
ncbi:histidine phosphatase family protein [Microbacterium aerolatum]|uniref:Putative phosphatase PhoE n=1 Tax=Microbacterium aerolatum TaxID=153731 RepID=A0A511AHC0_9MICO|nr:histidine phosphatase family protein [Microbacterium aerolatum]GEK87372.1 putative phosphatase PhoE [Microbacterium aerolatum]GGB32994.1 putative phosphatase PhoE [Microbacterium aerolatum]